MDYKDYVSGYKSQYFWFKAKKKLLHILLSKIPIHQNQNILDIGAGTGDDICILNKFGKVHVLDCNQMALDLIPNESIATKTVGDACNLPYKDNTFDIVVALDVLEHIEDDNQAITEIHRVLKSNGFFIFTVPAYQKLYSAHDKYLGHVRRYNKKLIKNRLSLFKKITLGSWLFFLLPCAIIDRTLHKKQHHTLEEKTSRFVNNLFYFIMSIENFLIKHGIRFPCGLTIYGIYQK